MHRTTSSDPPEHPPQVEVHPLQQRGLPPPGVSRTARDPFDTDEEEEELSLSSSEVSGREEGEVEAEQQDSGDAAAPAPPELPGPARPAPMPQWAHGTSTESAASARSLQGQGSEVVAKGSPARLSTYLSAAVHTIFVGLPRVAAGAPPDVR